MAHKKSTRSTVNKSEPDIDSEENLSADGRMIVTLLTKQLDILRDEFREQIQAKDKIIGNLKVEVNTLRTRLMKIEERMEEDDCTERKNMLLFSGGEIPTAIDGENCSKIVQDLMKNKLGIIMQPSDISTSGRLGRKPSDKNKADHRSICVKLVRHDLKTDILSTCRRAKPNFYVNESLTPARSTILYVLRKIKRKYPNLVDGCSSIDGKVYAWVKPTDSSSQRNSRVSVNSHLQLSEFCANVVKDSLNSFLDVWPH